MIELVTDATYDPGKVDEYMGYFPRTEIEEHSAELGDLANPSSADVAGHFSYSFMLYNCDCAKVDQWLQRIVASTKHYTSYNLVCPYAPATSNVIIEEPATTKAPPTPKLSMWSHGSQNTSLLRLHRNLSE
ncbi:hypothetical protein TELCIR_26201 [Teladorsagia circumcincta]|uniref:Uncharacterized protein n=1 Tax=Teladorsagia circumcincta TaxID=45464 RepID=A0A2G9T3H2_TELCI|nr:hypothetical protein TELCIR_26201 [Teladorsagia circumcincta]